MYKIYCHNVRVWTRDIYKNDSFYWKTRMKGIKELIFETAPEILCLQELSFPANLFIPNRYKRVGVSISHPIYVRKDIKVKHHRFYFRFDVAEIKFDDKPITIINVHLHWNKNIFKRCMNKINKVIEKAVNKGNDVIICGDFNNGRLQIQNLLNSDMGIKYNEDYTFKNKKLGYTSCIDHFCINANLFKYTSVKTILNDNVSDHRPIILEVCPK